MLSSKISLMILFKGFLCQGHHRRRFYSNPGNFAPQSIALALGHRAPLSTLWCFILIVFYSECNSICKIQCLCMHVLISPSSGDMSLGADLSYVSNPTHEPYMYQAIPDRLRCLATEDPERVAFVFYNFDGQRQAITRNNLYKNAELLAKHFVSLGMRKGSWVGICMNNSINTLYVIHGVFLAGGIPFFLVTNLKDGSDLIETMNDMN